MCVSRPPSSANNGSRSCSKNSPSPPSSSNREPTTYRSAPETPRPFEPKGQAVICSYHFAAAKSAGIQAVKWDPVVIDEAHRLRNIYKRTNKIASAVADAIASAPKILMTATPLRNSLTELYGLVSIVDPPWSPAVRTVVE